MDDFAAAAQCVACATPPQAGEHVWVPSGALQVPPSARNTVASRCEVLHVAGGSICVRRVDGTGGAAEVPVAAASRCSPPASLPLPAWRQRNGALWESEVRRAVAREACIVMERLRHATTDFERRMAAAGLDANDERLLQRCVHRLVDDGHVGPATAETLRDCLAEHILCAWEKARPKTGCGREDHDLRRQARRQIASSAHEWLHGTGYTRAAAGLLLLQWAAGETQGDTQ